MTFTLRSATAATNNNTNTNTIPANANDHEDLEEFLPPSSQGVRDTDELDESRGIHRYRNNVPLESSDRASSPLQQDGLDILMEAINSTSNRPTTVPAPSLVRQREPTVEQPLELLTGNQSALSKPPAKRTRQTASSPKKSTKGKEKAVDDSTPLAGPSNTIPSSRTNRLFASRTGVSNNSNLPNFTRLQQVPPTSMNIAWSHFDPSTLKGSTAPPPASTQFSTAPPQPASIHGAPLSGQVASNSEPTGSHTQATQSIVTQAAPAVPPPAATTTPLLPGISQQQLNAALAPLLSQLLSTLQVPNPSAIPLQNQPPSGIQTGEYFWLMLLQTAYSAPRYSPLHTITCTIFAYNLFGHLRSITQYQYGHIFTTNDTMSVLARSYRSSQ
jgi:hypothetical protein